MNFTLSLFQRNKCYSMFLLFLGISFVFLSSSCSSLPEKFPGLKVQKKRKKAVSDDFDASLNRLDEALVSQRKLKESLDQRLAILEEKHNKREIETQTYTRLKDEYTSMQKDADLVISSIKEAKSEVLDFQSQAPTKRRYYSDYEMETKSYLTNAIDKIEKVSKTSLNKSKDLVFYDDLLGNDLSEEFELSVFFPSGVYTLKEDELPVAKEAFMPLVNQITGFVNKYPDKTLSIRIMTKGYADAQAIKKTSKLGEKLAKLSNEENIDSKELNRVLSELRAKEISKFILEIISEGNPNLLNDDKYQINMEPVGMGESYPDPSISDYAKDDRRRRIVSLFWDVFPSR